MDEPAKAWLDEYRSGRVEALGFLVEHYRKPLFGFIHRMVNHPDEAEEVFQEVWLRVIKNVHRYEDQRFLSWLFRIAHNLVIDRVRRTRPVVELSAPMGSEGDTLESRVPSSRLGPDGEAAGHELGGRIRSAVNQLPPEQREVFLMRTEGDLSFKEIARIQQTSINTALARMHYALHKLRDELKGDYAALARG